MHGQSSPVSCILISCFFQSDFALKVFSDFCSAQYVQNMNGSPDCSLSRKAPGDATLRSSVGVKFGSCFTSSGLLTSEAGVKRAGTGRVGSRPTGYERGSCLLILEREELEEAMEGAMSLLPVDEEKVDARESRDRHDDPEDAEEVVLEVEVDMKDDATELRRDSMACENMR
jgi:hypothetical protein